MLTPWTALWIETSMYRQSYLYSANEPTPGPGIANPAPFAELVEHLYFFCYYLKGSVCFSGLLSDAHCSTTFTSVLLFQLFLYIFYILNT